MGGEITAIPAVPTEPISNADWRDLLNEISSADASTFVRLVVHKETADAPPGKEYDFPASYFSFIPKFVATIPVEDPPPVVTPPQPVQMYVVSSNGVFLHTATDTSIASRKGSLSFAKDVKVNPDTTTANGFIWRIIAAGEPNAGLFVAEKSSDGVNVILSTTRP